MEWEKTFHTGVSWDSFYSVAECSDGGYVFAGRYDTWTYGWQGWVLKTDSNGSVVFNRNYGDTASDYFNSVAECSDGGYILAGRTGSYGSGGFDGWVMKVNSTGFEEWNYTFGGSYSDYFNSVAECSDGGYILVGRYDEGGWTYNANVAWAVKIDSSGGLDWNRTYGGSSHGSFFDVDLVPGGGYVLAGWVGQPYPLYGEGWVVKLNDAGDVVWNNTFGGTSYDTDMFYSLTTSMDGGFVLVGRNESAGDGNSLWTVKVNSSGGLVWDHTYGGSDYDGFYSVVNCSDGGFVLAGQLGEEGYILKIDSSGGVVWDMVPGGPTDDGLYCVANCSDGGYILAGYKNVDYYNDGWGLKLYYPPVVSHTVSGTITYHGAGQSGAVVNVTTSQGTYSNTSTAGGAYIVQVQVYEYPGESIYVESSYNGCNNTTGPVTPTGSITTVDMDIAPVEPLIINVTIEYCEDCYSGAIVNVTTNAGTWENTTNGNGIALFDALYYPCPADDVIINLTVCGQVYGITIPGESVSNPLNVNIQISITRQFIIRGNVTYHGTGQTGVAVNVTTNDGTWNNTTGPGGAYIIPIQVCDCQVDAIYDDIFINASYGGCVNNTLIQSIGDTAIVDFDLTPSKPHTVSGTITYHGAAQAGAAVSVTTNAGIFTGTSGVGGFYSIAAQIYDCPSIGDITVSASYNGKTNNSTSAATGSATTLNVDIEPIDPCDCVAHGYYPECTYWLLPGCDKPEPTGHYSASTTTATTTVTATTAAETATTTATTNTITTTSTDTTSNATTTTQTTVPTQTTPQSQQDSSSLIAGAIILIIIAGTIVAVIFLRR